MVELNKPPAKKHYKSRSYSASTDNVEYDL